MEEKGQSVIRVAIFSQNMSVVEVCQSEIQRLGGEVDVHAHFLEADDARLLQYRLWVIDVEHSEQSGWQWLKTIRTLETHRAIAAVLVSAFLTEAEVSAMQDQYPGTLQVLVSAPVVAESFAKVAAYFIRERGVAVESTSDLVSLKGLYERAAMEDFLSETASVSDTEKVASHSDVASHPDVDSLRQALLLKEQELERVSTVVDSLHQKVTQTLATVDRLQTELADAQKTKENAEIRMLSLQDEMERLKQHAKRERDALVDEFRLKLAQKDVLFEEYQELKTRFSTYQKRLPDEVKQVRLREKELEHQLQTLHSDTHLLLAAKDQRILDLTQKIESLYEHIGKLSDRLRNIQTRASNEQDRQSRVLKALRLASSLLEEEKGKVSEQEKEDAQEGKKAA